MHCETESLHGQYENKKVNTKIRVLPQEAGFRCVVSSVVYSRSIPLMKKI